MPSASRLILLCLFLLAASLGADPSAVEIQRAHYLEETLGDLESALTIYRKLAEDKKTPLRWRAEATFGLARCYDAKESYVTANRYYLEVIKEFGEFKALANRAGDEILANSRILALDGGALSERDHLLLGNLAQVLDAAAENDEFELAGEVCEELQKLFERVITEVEGTPEEDLFAGMTREVELIAQAVATSKGEEVRSRLLKAEELGIYFDGFHVPDPGEVFSPALRWKDRVARALAENDGPRATRFCHRISEYLKPLTELPVSAERAYANSLAQEAVTIAVHVQADDFPGARRALFEWDCQRAKSGDAIIIYMEGFEDAPETLLPSLCATITWMEEAVDHLGIETEESQAALEQALAAATLLNQLALGTSADREAAEVLKELKALKAGRIEEVRKLLEMEEN